MSYGLILEDHPSTISGLLAVLERRGGSKEICESISHLAQALDDIDKGELIAPDWCLVDMHIQESTPNLGLIGHPDIVVPNEAEMGMAIINNVLIQRPEFRTIPIIATSEYPDVYSHRVEQLREKGYNISFVAKDDLAGRFDTLFDKDSIEEPTANTADLTPSEYYNLFVQVATYLGFDESKYSHLLGMTNISPRLTALDFIRSSNDAKERVRTLMEIANMLAMYRADSGIPKYLSEKTIEGSKTVRDWLLDGTISDLMYVKLWLQDKTGGPA